MIGSSVSAENCLPVVCYYQNLPHTFVDNFLRLFLLTVNLKLKFVNKNILPVIERMEIIRLNYFFNRETSKNITAKSDSFAAFFKFKVSFYENFKHVKFFYRVKFYI